MKKKKIWLTGLLLFVLVQTIGCATLYNNYGKITPDGAVTQTIERYEVDPGLTYYISGSSSIPNAIMGLNATYTLNSDLWNKVAMTPEVMKELVSGMQGRASGFSRSFHGFAILDDKGRKIGIWYSLLDTSTYVKVVDDKTVIVNTPPLGTFDRHEGNDRDRMPKIY